ncbi:hypothetical protein OP10G_3519 [Fimbriimonas ginsengisoli Gsoil 348]|uniref:DUF4397 domain-containing protein n=1 Tax=Fimbriimonas ginsengisoli Gsoil 348 TaxID=661478 RepID=A0A068NU42_FIMGI|nr:hypothetical protein OP10G_3519 [Fimbriimonas ginsengisoli Gsoil 348]
MNAISNPASVSLAINSQTINGAAPYGYASDYTVFNNGNRSIVVSDSTTGGALLNTNELFELDHYYTVIAYRNGGGTYSEMKLSDVPALSGSDGQVRIVNVSNQTVDVYLTAVGADITGTVPTINDLTTGDTAQQYLIRTPGAYTVTVTNSDNQTILYTKNISVTGREAQTVVVTGNAGTPILALPGRHF